MKQAKVLFLIFLYCNTLSLVSCSDDDSMKGDMEEVSVDITTKIVGMYTGHSRFNQDGSFFTENERNATIEKLTDSTTTIRITSVSGTIFISAMLDSDSNFKVDAESIYTEGPFSGVGSIVGDSLEIEMTASNNIIYGYSAVRN